MHHKKCVHPVVPREGRANPTLPSPSLIYADTVRRVLFPVPPTEATERTERTEFLAKGQARLQRALPSVSMAEMSRQAPPQGAHPPVSTAKAEMSYVS